MQGKRKRRNFRSGLLKNAIESTPDEGRIELICKTGGKGVKIGFQDSGVGISQENHSISSKTDCFFRGGTFAIFSPSA